ncbi:hypothetical protein HBI56_042960 [Parastagonospora nodorum]|uniref:Uncharacterized protein n=2 Tax=Phaeosphaeria nodorum (strain SN15 / ATCC MYA-4574 / FGSC 10173) TaxID=321614 RepID=A0A7U2EUV4_PHANO|nr:hypothetical protein SNOG_03379 [Parastagonospora nodorum SN15]KAH3904032.1 hypothetical protein HBH56_240150 [Parastagonospora nodorum]EAT88584.1 hypothetical protein SNOG_03379 [Parastagonospora nodorum SN15]KAH3932572.1 hypothetical protein HBH54_084290 [Parastagonospora nodorum]KAH4005150.1 hypothetical protein HBI10_046260 [Parastagonospora nodorum]KAH4031167.1 hypothetical protein HBI13_029710 [Parastagonospora nodorum]
MYSTCVHSMDIFAIHVREVSTQIPARVTTMGCPPLTLYVDDVFPPSFDWVSYFNSQIPTPAPPMLPIAVSCNFLGLRKRGVRTYGTLVLIHTGRDNFFVSPVTLKRTSKGPFCAFRTRYSYLLCYPNGSIANNCKSQVRSSRAGIDLNRKEIPSHD